MRKKGQAAMEFLMTYGWAILVVLIVVGALSYYGVLSPQNLLPERCLINVGLDCQAFTLNGDDSATATLNEASVKIKVLNTLGENIVINSVNYKTPEGHGCAASKAAAGDAPLAAIPVTGITVRNGLTAVFEATGCEIAIGTGFAKNDKVKYNMEIQYYTQAGGPQFTHTIQGDLFGNAQ